MYLEIVFVVKKIFFITTVFVLVSAITAEYTAQKYKWPVEIKELFNPPLQEIADVLNKGLQKYFSEVQVDVVNCPDLRERPFTLANAGLNGKTRLVSTGDPEYAFQGPNFWKVYDVRDYLEVLGLSRAFVIGTHNGPREFVGISCEGICNINFMDGRVNQLTRAVVVTGDTSYETRILPKNETRFNTQGDHFVSQGEPGPVLRIHLRKRIGSDSFSISIRKVLENHYGSKIIGLGGVCLIKKGKALHILVPDLPQLKRENYSPQWLKYYNMSAPLVSLGIIATGAYDLGLRRQHFHSFSYHKDGGHYLMDTTPDEVEYLAYLNLAEYVYRIDRPPMRKVSMFSEPEANFNIF